jgi:hypothetical protein
MARDATLSATCRFTDSRPRNPADSHSKQDPPHRLPSQSDARNAGCNHRTGSHVAATASAVHEGHLTLFQLLHA